MAANGRVTVISALRNRVSISGRREIPRENEACQLPPQERPEGAFNRTVTVPMEVDPERVDARYAEGVLTLTLPKAEQTKPRQIAVRT
jgi:HSP20 family protein